MNSAELREYWRGHEQRWSGTVNDNDPDGLEACLSPGASKWQLRYLDRLQRRVFEHLLRQVPHAQPGARALDIGCGAGRWTRLLRDNAYDATGIDLQGALIKQDRDRDPAILRHPAP